MVRFTVRTVPFPNVQRQLFNDVPTLAASLRTRKPAVNLDQRATSMVALVLKLSDQLAPTGIADRERKLPILHRVLHRQILDGDGFGFHAPIELSACAENRFWHH